MKKAASYDRPAFIPSRLGMDRGDKWIETEEALLDCEDCNSLEDLTTRVIDEVDDPDVVLEREDTGLNFVVSELGMGLACRTPLSAACFGAW